MNELILHAFNLSAAATGALVSAIWQGALLAAIVFLVLRMLPGFSAAARSVIWLNVFILLALLHILPVFTGGLGGHHAQPAAASSAVRIDPRWSLAVAALWLAMSLFRVGQLIAGAVHLRRTARNAVTVDIPEIWPLLMHNGRQVELCVSGDVSRPSVMGFFRPRILVPPGLLEQLSSAELTQVILHEMEHLHRGDDWTNLLQKLALVVFPLNPALVWVERRLCAERELACDDRVLNAGSGRKAYALCLTHLAEFALVRRGFSLVLGAWERRPELVRRVHRILGEPVRQMGQRRAQVAMGGLIAGALVCTLALANAPEIVRFTPPLARTAQAQNMFTATDARQPARQRGCTAHLAKSVALVPGPAQKSQQVARQAAQEPTPRAVACRRAHNQEAPERLAGLRMPPPPAEVTGALLVMTDWDDLGLPPQLVFAVERAQQIHPTVMVRRAYAVVRTPDGWLVIKI